MTDSPMTDADEKSVGIVGGGVAGLAAAAALCDRGFRVELFESQRQLGGRARSFPVKGTGKWFDHGQHVGMGCCTELLDFCRLTGIDGLFRRDNVLHFFGPDGKRFDVAASRWLPAPLHLAPSLLRLGYLSRRERHGIILAMRKLTRQCNGDSDDRTIGDWLRDNGQSQQAIDRFWSVVLTSALGETVDRASLAAAGKVFREGFMAGRDAYHLLVPTVTLRELFNRHVAEWLTGHGVQLHLDRPVQQVLGNTEAATGLQLSDGPQHRFDHVIVALSWRRVRDVFSDAMAAAIPELAHVGQIEGSPITGVHLWLDRPITTLPHAVLIGRLSQWVFQRGVRGEELGTRGSGIGDRDSGLGDGEPSAPQIPSPEPLAPSPSDIHYYQVVISASRHLAGRDRQDVLSEVLDDLRSVFPEAAAAELVNSRISTQPNAVFSVRPGLDAIRPPQRTPIGNLFLAGDWTDTGWPSTLEGAVRSGYAAAAAIRENSG